jgi:hypothetical protein
MHKTLNHRIRILTEIIKKKQNIIWNPVLYWIDLKKHYYNLRQTQFLKNATFVLRKFYSQNLNWLNTVKKYLSSEFNMRV